jgi:hypothetical protein
MSGAIHDPSLATASLTLARTDEQIGDPTLADGILDRLVHNSHAIALGHFGARRPFSKRRER